VRVERNQSRPASSSPVARSKPTSQSEGPSTPQPTESWDGPTVDEREPEGPQDIEEPTLHLPGIAEGLTNDYLRSRSSESPKTLLAPCLVPSPFILKEFPSIARNGEPTVDYATNLAAHTKALYQRYFSDYFLDLDLLIQVQVGAGNNGGYEWVQGRSRLTLQTDNPLERGSEPHLQKTVGALEADHRFRRGVSDLISFVHEYAHATYDALLGVSASVDVGCANRSFSEGFAVLLELLAIDHLLQLETHQIIEGDREDLAERRNQRVRWLQQVLQGPSSPAHLAYAEGTELMANLHRAGGLPRVTDFVKAVVPNKANSLSRQHPDYHQAVGDPAKMRTLVSA
jgi:hypothetical protein